MRLFFLLILAAALCEPVQLTAQTSSEVLEEIDIFNQFGTIPDEVLETETGSDYPYEFLDQLTSVRLEETPRGIIAIIDNLVRLKIYSDEPIHIAEASTVGIPFYFADGIERIVNLEGWTHHKDGTKTPLQTSFARTSELNSRYRILEFEMPAAGAGDVLEYKYTMERRYIEELPDFYFTNQVPTRKAAFYLKNSEFARYEVVPQNVSFDVHYEEHRVDTSGVPLIFTYTRPAPVYIQIWEAEDIPAANVSSFIASVDDVRAKLKFQINEFGLPRQPLENSWEFIAAQILRNDNPFLQVAEAPFLEKKGHEIGSFFDNETARLDSIFSYVNSRVEFNGLHSIFPGQDWAAVLESQHPASQADINLTLLALLRGAGLEARPAYLSNRKYGRINEEFPSLFQFNSMMVLGEADGREYFMDASFPHSLPGLIPTEMYSGSAMALSDSSHTWKEIKPERSRFFLDVHIEGELDASGNLKGRLSAVSTGYPAQRIRMQKATGVPDKEMISSIFFDAYIHTTISDEIVEIQPEYPDSTLLEANFEIPDYAISFSEGLQFNPMITGYLSVNPFEDSRRSVPVTLDAPEELSFSYTIRLPDGYQLPEAGETRTTSLAGASLFEEYLMSGRTLEYYFDIDISSKEFSAEQYGQLRELYSRWVELSTNYWFIETE